MYIVSLKQFDGPLDLLLTLITHAKVDIHDIFVSEITEQYPESMKLVDELDMDSASEFLQMAATLLEIKSRAMLPKPPKPEDENELSPEEALIRQLEEYRQFKSLAQERGISLTVALREAAEVWMEKQQNVDPNDPLFEILEQLDQEPLPDTPTTNAATEDDLVDDWTGATSRIRFDGDSHLNREA